MLFLGTGAAELCPNPFCNCLFCESLRKSGEMPRKRSCMLLDAHNMIDFGPDVLASAQMYGARLYDVDHVFITHSHEDHLCITNIEGLAMTPQRSEKPLHVYLSLGAHAFLQQYMQALRPVFARGETVLETLIKKGVVVLHPVTPYASFDVGEQRVFAIESNHMGNGKGEYALNYIFTQKSGQKLLYACDTGLYSAKNLDVLKGCALDVMIMEGTFGDVKVNPETSGHMNAEHFVLQIQNMLACGAITQDTVVYMTHINQVQNLNHSAYQAYMDQNSPIPVIITHDGLRI